MLAEIHKKQKMARIMGQVLASSSLSFFPFTLFMISAILFLNEKGETILVRNYRGDIRFARSRDFHSCSLFNA
jgi:hypothetical protein